MTRSVRDKEVKPKTELRNIQVQETLIFVRFMAATLELFKEEDSPLYWKSKVDGATKKIFAIAFEHNLPTFELALRDDAFPLLNEDKFAHSLLCLILAQYRLWQIDRLKDIDTSDSDAAPASLPQLEVDVHDLNDQVTSLLNKVTVMHPTMVEYSKIRTLARTMRPHRSALSSTIVQPAQASSSAPPPCEG